jgi:hypothetical protein
VTGRALLGLLGCVATAGCASSRGHDKMLGYTDHNLFVIEHHDPAHGGRIVGTVCAVDLQLDAQLTRHGVILRGGAGNQHDAQEGMDSRGFGGGVLPGWVPNTGRGALPIYLETRDRPGLAERDIIGVIGGDSQASSFSHSIDLKLTRERVSGQVGERRFDLRVHGDDYVGSLQINDNHMPFVLRGAEQLWAMPAAAQATVLPLLMSCDGAKQVIQVVDLRQFVGPPPMPPRWWAPAPSLPARPLDRMSRPGPDAPPTFSPATTPRIPPMARVRA